MPVATNQIRDVTFRPVDSARNDGDDGDGDADLDEGGHALFMALDVAAPDLLLGFLEEVVGRFKRERMTGPSDARFMLITVIGDISAADFALAWQAAISNDPPARALLGTLHQADVMQGNDEGHVFGQASLLAS